MRVDSRYLFLLMFLGGSNACPTTRFAGYRCDCPSRAHSELGGWMLFCYRDKSSGTTTTQLTIPSEDPLSTTIQPFAETTTETILTTTGVPQGTTLVPLVSEAATGPPTTRDASIYSATVTNMESSKMPHTTAAESVSMSESTTLVAESALNEEVIRPSRYKHHKRDDPSNDDVSTDKQMRVSSSKLQDGITEMPHLVRMRTRSARQRREIGENLYRTDDEDVQVFSIEYSGTDMKIQCNEEFPAVPRLLKYVNVTQVETLYLEYCALPPDNIPYKDIFAGNRLTVHSMVLTGPKLEDGYLKAAPFRGFSEGMRTFSIQGTEGDKLKHIEPGFFNGFSALTFLDFYKNQLSKISSEMFQNLTSLVTLNLSENPIARIPSKLLDNLVSLKTLDLQSSEINEIESGAFSNLKNLEILELSDNPLEKVPDTLFFNLSSLINLSLRRTKLSTLPQKLFSRNQKLLILVLDEVNFDNGLDGNIFEGLVALQNLSMSNCNLKSLPQNLLQYSPNLKNLELMHNNITSLPADFFNASIEMTDLDLSYNYITSLPYGLFDELKKLVHLNLFGNELVSISADDFNPLHSLSWLDIGYNEVKEIHPQSFSRLNSLSFVYLKQNKLVEIDRGVFQLPNLQELDLSENAIQSFPRFNWLSLLKLKSLNISNNRITTFVLPSIIAPITIDLTNNPIELINVTESTSTERRDFVEYIVNTDRLNCNCSALSFNDYIRIHKNNLGKFSRYREIKCSSGRLLKSMHRADFICPLTVEQGQAECPSSCDCYKRAYDNTVHVNCSSRNLNDVPHLPHTATHIDFTNNTLVTLNITALSVLKELRNASFDGNNIDSISGLLEAPGSLEILSLRDNSISSIPPNEAIVIPRLHYKLRLAGNTLDCSCQTDVMGKSLKSGYQKIIDFADLKCEQYFLMNGTRQENTFSRIPDEVYCPRLESGVKAQLIIAGVIVILAILAMIIVILYYRNEYIIKVFVYTHFYHIFVCFFPGDIDEGKRFDAFISYSHKDRDVAQAILKELEQPVDESDEPLFKFCIHERDWLAGYGIPWNILNSVQNSRKTILVVSQEFAKSLWCDVEFHTAYVNMLQDRMDRLIIIVKGERPAKEDIDKNLELMLNTKTYLTWESPYFWQSLKYALHHQGQRIAKKRKSSSNNSANKQIPMNVIINNRMNMPSSADVHNIGETIENLKNKKYHDTHAEKEKDNSSSLKSKPEAVTRPTMVAKHRTGDHSYGQFNEGGGHINQAFTSISTEDISIKCDTLKNSVKNKEIAKVDNVGNPPPKVVGVVESKLPLSARHRANGKRVAVAATTSDA